MRAKSFGQLLAVLFSIIILYAAWAGAETCTWQSDNDDKNLAGDSQPTTSSSPTVGTSGQ